VITFEKGKNPSVCEPGVFSKKIFDKSSTKLVSVIELWLFHGFLFLHTELTLFHSTLSGHYTE